MDADTGDSPLPPLTRGPNPYLGGDRCLLCRCERPQNEQEVQLGVLEGEEGKRPYALVES